MSRPPQSRSKSKSRGSKSSSNGGGSVSTRKHDSNNNDDLRQLEIRLRDQVDPDLFDTPKHFRTLDRVIDVLGSELEDVRTDFESIRQKNPAYRALKKQLDTVEETIEFMAVAHCAELNTSVVQVGKVARQFSEAVNKVRCLRRQVQEIKESLGSGGAAGAALMDSPNKAGGVPDGSPLNPASMSLRELWLKKLESEAVLSLLNKLEIIRSAPAEFDTLVRPRTGGPCRIGAAVVSLTSALDIVFSNDVAQVGALHRITEQLMSRKQRAEEIIWDTLHDVIYLRTGNGGASTKKIGGGKAGSVSIGGGMHHKGSSAASVGHSVGSDSKSRRRSGGAHKNFGGNSGSMSNPFFKSTSHYAMEEDYEDDDDDDNDSVSSTGSGASLFSRDDASSIASSQPSTTVGGSSVATKTTTGTSTMSYMNGNTLKSNRMMIPYSMIDAELDLEQDERRCLEDSALSGIGVTSSKRQSLASRLNNRPRYADHVLALRILVESLARLRCLDDIERYLKEGMEQEIRKIAQREQARTFARLEKLRGRKSRRSARASAAHHDLKEFRRHLTGLLSAFGCVMVRLSHLAQIVRHRITSDPKTTTSFPEPNSVLRPVMAKAYYLIQLEIRGFLSACLTVSAANDEVDAAAASKVSSTQGLFSLGIVDAAKGDGDGYSNYGTLTLSRASTVDLAADKYVMKVLLPMTNVAPEVRHALTFRRSLSRWTDENELLRKELADMTGEDTSSPSYQSDFRPRDGEKEMFSLEYLDLLIKKHLLPVLQDEAVNGTVQALERPNAFDPVFERNLYARSASSDPQDVDMCVACQSLYNSTGPLFMALHRLPAGGEMYLPLVAVLEHVMLTFISRVKQRVGTLTTNKTALRIMLDSSAGNKEMSFGSIMERRRAFAMLLQGYADADLLEGSSTEEVLHKDPNLMPLAPPSNDTKPKTGGVGADSEPVISALDLAGGVDREEQNLKYELAHLTPLLEFTKDVKMKNIVVCQDEELMRAATLAHSLLKLSSMLESRLKAKGSGFYKPLTSTRALREAIKSIKTFGVKMAKFCRIDMILQTVIRLSKICKSSTIVAKDAVRLPSCVNDLGEYLGGASDNLREAGGNAVTAYTFSCLEQYIPLFLMETVRVIARGQGIVTKSPLTLNGVEALDRSGSVLYRDLKGATSFDNSFWDDELAAVSFERSASFMAMVELEMDELEAYFRANQDDFSDKDFQLMFEMDGPRRRGDIGRYNMMKRRIKN